MRVWCASLCSIKIYNNHFAQVLPLALVCGSIIFFNWLGNRHNSTTKTKREKREKSRSLREIHVLLLVFFSLSGSCCSTLMHFTPSSMIAGVKYRLLPPSPLKWLWPSQRSLSAACNVLQFKESRQHKNTQDMVWWYIKEQKQRRLVAALCDDHDIIRCCCCSGGCSQCSFQTIKHNSQGESSMFCCWFRFGGSRWPSSLLGEPTRFQELEPLVIPCGSGSWDLPATVVVTKSLYVPWFLL